MQDITIYVHLMLKIYILTGSFVLDKSQQMCHFNFDWSDIVQWLTNELS